MGRPRKEKRVKMLMENYTAGNTDKREMPRDMQLATKQMRQEITEAMRTFRRTYKLPHMYNDDES
jgi:hypothetical protein